MSEEDAIGYRRPPKATRWKKGQSGNPRGRAKGTPNLKAELLEEIGEKILIREQGKPKRVSKLRAAIKAQMAKAVQGDARATALILSTAIRMLETEAPPQDDEPISEEDAAIIANFLKRHQDKGGAG